MTLNKINIHLCKETVGKYNKVYYNDLMKWWDVINVHPSYFDKQLPVINDIKFCPFCSKKLVG